MMQSFDHVLLAMPRAGEAEARRFYGDLLGMSELEMPPVLAARGGAWFAQGEVVLHLGAEAEFAPARRAHPAIVVDDLEALEATLRAASYECTRSDGERPGIRRFHTFDCFGNRLEFQQG